MSEVRPNHEHRFPRLKLPFTGQVALGNGTQWLFVIEGHRQALFLAILQTSFRWGEKLRLVDADKPVKMTDLMALFKGMYAGDAGNIVDLLNDQRDGPPVPRQGYYHRNLLAGAQPPC